MKAKEFLDLYKKYFPLYIANGNPSEDTVKSYNVETANYIDWCYNVGVNYETATDLDARIYLRDLAKNYAPATIAIKISAVKTFYNMALKLDVVTKNPFSDIKTKTQSIDDSDFTYLTPSEIGDLLKANEKAELPETTKKRNAAIIMLMAVEGLRTIEINRMNDEDINLESQKILIHGKGHDGFIFPCADTMKILKSYLAIRPRPSSAGKVHPTFISFSAKTELERLSRSGIRWIINQSLIAARKKKRGVSCHSLRHSCGTNLYQATKDLRLVQETLRQKNPSVTARYAHIGDRMTNRTTEKISPFNV